MIAEGWEMLRKTMIALLAIASVAVLAPDAASARGGFGGGFHGGGIGMGGGGFRSAAISAGAFRGGTLAANAFHGGFHPGFRHRGFPIAAAAIGFGLGYGLYGYDYGYPYFADYGYDDYYGDGGCYIVQRRLPTPFGWRLRLIQVCN
jgi:hypothetical protein